MVEPVTTPFPAPRTPRRRLLFLLPFPPRLDAVHGGGKVIAQLLMHLAGRHDVALLYLRGSQEPPLDESLQARCAWVEEVPRAWTKQTTGDNLVRNGRLMISLLGGRPMWVTDWHSRLFEQRMRAAIAVWQPDIVQAEFHIMGQYLAQAGDARAARVLVQHEPSARAAPYLKRHVPLINAWLCRLDRAAWRRHEQSVICQASSVVVFTPADKAALSMRAPHPPVFVVPFGADLPEKAADSAGGCPDSLLFVGNFLHPPNCDAAIWLAQSIYPLLKPTFPALTLHIVGDQPPPALCQLAGNGIIVTGRVPDVAPYLDATAVCVAPMRAGGGMRVKVLEALAAGKAIVATPLAAEGLEVTDGEHLMLAETSEEMAHCIAALLREPARRKALGQRARAWAERHLGWQNCVAAYEAIYDALLSPSSAQTRTLKMAESTFHQATLRAFEQGRDDARRVERQPAALAALPLGRFNNIGMRGMTLRRSLLALGGAGHALVNATAPLAGRSQFVAWRQFALEFCYWRGAQQGCGADYWQRLTRGPIILMYHAVGRSGEPAGRYIIPERMFARQMDWLSRKRYHVIGLDALLQLRQKGQLPPARSVVITFDDGYRDNDEVAFPILQRHGYAATIFIVSSAVGTANVWDRGGELAGRPLLTWQEIDGMQAGGVMAGGHSRTHRPLPGLSSAALKDEVAGCKVELERRLSRPVTGFAYPHGRHDVATQDAVASAGFAGACCSAPGVNDPVVCQWALRRLEVRGTASLADFALMLEAGKNRVLSRLIRAE